ncbi:hypothetical protein GOP47_0005901 [Adiantum capillus-veneris]|uniref:Pentatricopeptide repeat-containing protein n=1 Tax=Adiantum capillus-veneris TaxID=13818 RepID=A0A9D4V2F9_ADICA|nr:hypothetical protein GOP47_0005901 [Adiantum capillus-veneris]
MPSVPSVHHLRCILRARRELQHALILYQEMQEMLLYPDECSILGLLKACAQLKDVSTGDATERTSR